MDLAGIAESNAWIERFQITNNAGAYRTKAEVIKTAANELRKFGVPNPTTTARRWIEDAAWLKRRTGETAGSIARGVADEHEVVMQYGKAWPPDQASKL